MIIRIYIRQDTIWTFVVLISGLKSILSEAYIGPYSKQNNYSQNNIQVDENTMNIIVLTIRMHTAKQVIHPEKGHHHRCKGYNGTHVKRPCVLTCLYHPHVQDNRIDHHCN